ncbi:MAG: hypothetical protein JWP15_2117 [Alphaproteobacteria bacterium]|nr:hypothetical protein [Alphaproteobacteria bacterium]
MNSQEIMVVVIVAVVMIASVIKSRYKFDADREKRPEGAESLRLKEEVRTLRERIQVLERIATDKDSALEREIERLRDH